jgi:cytoskeletal protein CcmA (bactofilin family)
MANEFVIKNGFQSKGNSEITGSLKVSGSTNFSGSVYIDSLSKSTERVLTITGSQVTASLELEEFQVIELETALSTYTGSIACATLTVSQSAVLSGSVTIHDLYSIGNIYITPSSSLVDTGSWKLEISGSELRLEKYNGSTWDWSTTFTI